MHAINTKRKEELRVLDQRKLVLYLLFLQRVFEHQLIHNQPTQLAIFMRMCGNTTFRTHWVRRRLLGINGIILKIRRRL